MTREWVTTTALWATGIAFTMLFGAALFVAVAMVPNWAADVPGSLYLMHDLFEQGPTEIRTYFVPLAVVTMMTIIVALITGWHEKHRRKWIVFIGVVYVVFMALNLAVILPVDLFLFSAPRSEDPAQLASATSRFVVLHWIRIGIMGLGALTALWAANLEESSSQAVADTGA